MTARGNIADLLREALTHAISHVATPVQSWDSWELGYLYRRAEFVQRGEVVRCCGMWFPAMILL